MDYLSKRFTTKKVFLVAFAIAALALSCCAGYGFDSGASCSEKTARRGRAQLIKSIPCDLTVQAYCNLPGTMYPWNAVRRFVNENQGMMKRMYGDVRHISVLRNEINNNDITLDDVEETAIRYSRAGWKRNKFMYQDSSKTKNNDLLAEAHYRRNPSTNNRSTGRSTTKASSRATHRAGSSTVLASSETPENVSTSTDTSTVSATTSAGKKLKPTEKREKMTSNKQKLKKPVNSRENESEYEQVIEAAIEEIFVQIQNDDDNKESNNIFTNVTEEVKTPVAASASLNSESDSIAEATGIDMSSQNKTEEALAATISTTLRIYGFPKEEQVTTPASLNETIESTTERIQSDELRLERSNVTIKGQLDDNTIKIEQQNPEGDGEKDNDTPVDDSNSAESINSETIVDVNGKPADKLPKPVDENSVGQLFQDVADKEEPVFINSRGVNACPVKEEVVAPFWANNTRGEVLALLNLYPFEQYVHWEKCTQEHKQMYCRDGCRCEQQYRLHRLLAYDPHNECRGIFSDWFRFPSCCICKCYDIPFEYRVTSRSPRSMGKFFNEDAKFADQVHSDDGEHSDAGDDGNQWYEKAFENDDFSELMHGEHDEMHF